MGIEIGQVSSKKWIKKLPHESKNWGDVIRSRVLHENHFV